MIDYVAARTAMVDCQVRPSDVTRYPIIAAMLGVPRERFVPGEAAAVAYMDENIQLSSNRAILAPRTLAKMLDAVEFDGSELVLNVGTNHGYTAAILARLAEAVVALEEDPILAASAATALSEAGADNVAVEEGPLVAGAAGLGPYDVIFIDGAVETLPPALVDQLRMDGRIILLRSQGPLCYAELGVKGPNGISTRRLFDATAPVLPGFSTDPAFIF
ncbi:MAG: protein-L-isoaspartate O-methyltransferase [Pseudomonadota bacterium]